jgi:CBS domain-containing protein
MKRDLIKDWMTQDVQTITPDTTVPEAHRLMTQNNIRRLPVLDGKRLVGIVTRGDVRGAEASDATSLSIWELNYLLGRLEISKVMTKKPITVSPESTIREAAQTMLDNKISGLPVVDDKDKVVGIITESDIFRLVVSAWSED